MQWAAAGQVPARLSVRNSPEFARLPVQSAFAQQIPHMVYPPRTPAIFEVQLEIDRAVERVIRGQSTPQVALDDANLACQKILDRDKREHPTDYAPERVQP